MEVAGGGSRTTSIRVQPLAAASRSIIPAEYIQPPAHRPARRQSTPAATIPIIDLAAPSDPIPDLRHVCREWGAFHVVNHGVPVRLIQEMKAAALGFFEAPMETKLRYACDAGSTATEGYGSRMLAKEDGVLDWRDYFDHHTLPESRRNPSRWPDFPGNYRDLVLEYSSNMKGLAQRLLHMISKSLGLPPTYIEEMIGDVYQNITVSYYSPCPQPELALGLQAHSDMGAITLLVQDDVGGLEIWKDGEWVLAQPLPDAIIVILADQTEVIRSWNDGVYAMILSGVDADEGTTFGAHRIELCARCMHAMWRHCYDGCDLTSEKFDRHQGTVNNAQCCVATCPWRG